MEKVEKNSNREGLNWATGITTVNINNLNTANEAYIWRVPPVCYLRNS